MQDSVHRVFVLIAILLVFPAIKAQTHTGSNLEVKSSNRLLDSASPYLLLHAHNPVDWYPWGEEAFARARAEDKPVFLSVGYSTCFWCHVAERTLYSDPEIAAVMNKFFINVKVDREQRPDVDRAYMLARQLMAGSGGWPNNVFLTPDREAFYAGSYFPPERDQRGRPGFSDVMASIHNAWSTNREDVMARVIQVRAALREINDGGRSTQTQIAVQADVWTNTAIRSLLRNFDALSGGFAPPTAKTKFPQAPTLSLLLTEYATNKDDSVAQVLTETLDAIAYGGIQDHLAGGFHRYSTTPDWSVPHFEKMLYDNVQLLRIYAQAWAQFENPLYRQTAMRIAHYLRTRMMSPQGGLYTAEDAQVDGVEGASYVWTTEQIVEVLGKEEAERFLGVYALEIVPHSAAAKRAAAGPIEEDGAVIRIRQPVQQLLDANGQGDIAQLLESFAASREQLLARRDQRKAPLRDDKLSVDLNGLGIDGFAAAGKALNEPAYIETAKRIAEHMWSTTYDSLGDRLFHQVFNGKASGEEFLADYAHFARGLLTLHTVTGERLWLTRARKLADGLIARFVEPQGQLRMSLSAGELPVPPQEHGDNDSPSGTSATIGVLVDLAAMDDGARFGAAASKILRRHAASVARQPSAWPSTLIAINTPAAKSIVVAANQPPPATQATRPRLLSTSDHVEVRAKVDVEASKILVTLKVEESFHVNANPASLDFLIPTKLSFSGATATAVTYPAALKFAPSFTRSTLDVYEGESTIIAEFAPGALRTPGTVSATLTTQACNDTVCLPPSTMPIQLSQ